MKNGWLDNLAHSHDMGGKKEKQGINGNLPNNDERTREKKKEGW